MALLVMLALVILARDHISLKWQSKLYDGEYDRTKHSITLEE